ncbi:hypothetical protein FXF51_01930 [Nonomuraea sp. PA05]|uniref:hypothetical protein n=1 Tax=Nonomuraea sp. PA05 TaxID=2604466 RepID=UPI0011D30313|nr:hypothetical protein [Nonomuraea sp. PA05]TYB71220.1 hypothetical protein FXF51_01930 [Nonomuraea sp. PA05]
MALTETERLERIARLVPPCPPPNVHEGYDLCPLHGVPWPCPDTQVNWLARGLDLVEAQRKHIDALPKSADLFLTAADMEYDPAEDDSVGSVGGGM